MHRYSAGERTESLPRKAHGNARDLTSSSMQSLHHNGSETALFPAVFSMTNTNIGCERTRPHCTMPFCGTACGSQRHAVLANHKVNDHDA